MTDVVVIRSNKEREGGESKKRVDNRDGGAVRMPRTL